MGVWACKGTPPPAPVESPAVEKKQAPPPAAPEPPITIGLAMPLGLDQSQTAASLIGTYFSNELKQPVTARLFTYDELSDALAQGTIDAAYISPLAYVKALKRSPVTVLRKAIHRGTSSYVSVLFVRNDSKIKGLDGLAKKRIAWVQKGSTSGNFIPRAMLAQQRKDAAQFFSEQLYLQDHGKVCEAVYSGTVDAGASFADAKPDGTRPTDDTITVDGCRSSLGDEKVKELRVLYTSELMPNDAVVVRAGFPVALAQRIGAVLDLLPTTRPGSELLHDGFHSDGFVSSNEGDFTHIRRLSDSFKDE
jgi:phosphate/phosphite/phosphonate ABC transporter binding protein